MNDQYYISINRTLVSFKELVRLPLSLAQGPDSLYTTFTYSTRLITFRDQKSAIGASGIERIGCLIGVGIIIPLTPIGLLLSMSLVRLVEYVRDFCKKL